MFTKGANSTTTTRATTVATFVPTRHNLARALFQAGAAVQQVQCFTVAPDSVLLAHRAPSGNKVNKANNLIL